MPTWFNQSPSLSLFSLSLLLLPLAPSRSLSFFVSGSSIPLLEKMSLCVEDDDATNAKKPLTHCLPIRFINCSNLSHLPTITGHAIFYRTDSPMHTHTLALLPMLNWQTYPPTLHPNTRTHTPTRLCSIKFCPV